MATASINSGDATKIIFRGGADLNSGRGGEVKFNGTSLTLRAWVFPADDPNAYPGNTAPVVSASVDGGEAVDVPVATQGAYADVVLASGLSDGPHVVVVSYEWNGILDSPCLTATGSAPGFWALTYLTAGGVSSPLSVFGVWDWPAIGSWNRLAGEICGSVVGSGDLAVYCMGFANPTNQLFVDVDGAETAHTPADNAFLPIASDLGQGSHSFAIRNETTFSAWGFYGDSSNPLLRVRSAPGAATPTLAAYSGRRYSPRDAARCEPAMAAIGENVGSTNVREMSCRAVVSSPTWEALVLRNGSKYVLRDGSTDGSLATLSGAGTVGWESLASGLSGSHTLEFRTPVDPAPKVYAFRTAAVGQSAPPTSRAKVLFVGDSITYAVQAGLDYGDSRKGWAYKVQTALPANAVNTAWPGYRSDQILGLLQDYCTAYGNGTVAAPDIVAAYVGMNDVTQDGQPNYPGGATVGPAGFGGYVKDIIDLAQATFPGVPILFLTIARSVNPPAADYNAALAATVATAGGEAAGVHLLDVAAVADTPANMYDGIHPTDAGWTAIANLATPAMASLLAPPADPLAVSLASSAITSTTATVTATPSGGTAPIAYAWTKDGAPMAGEASAVLNLTGLSPLTAYEIGCTATDAASDAAEASTTVNTTAATLTLSIAKTGGTSTTLAVTATAAGGTGSRTYAWSKDGQPVAGQSGAVLNLTGLSPSTTYAIGCTVTDSASATATASTSASTSAAALTLSLAKTSSTSTSLVVTATAAGGTGTKTYTWTKDGESVPGQLTAVLTLSGLAPSTTYAIGCTVADAASATATASTSAATDAAPTETYQRLNNAISRITAVKALGGPEITLANPERFGSPTPESPLKVSVFRPSTADPLVPYVLLAIYKVDGLAGGKLQIASAIEGTADVALIAGDVAANVPTAGD